MTITPWHVADLFVFLVRRWREDFRHAEASEWSMAAGACVGVGVTCWPLFWIAAAASTAMDLAEHKLDSMGQLAIDRLPDFR